MCVTDVVSGRFALVLTPLQHPLNDTNDAIPRTFGEPEVQGLVLERGMLSHERNQRLDLWLS